MKIMMMKRDPKRNLEKQMTIAINQYFMDQTSGIIPRVLISTPEYSYIGFRRLRIRVTCYMDVNDIMRDPILNTTMFPILIKKLSAIIKKDVLITIQMTQVHYPFMNRQILANYLVHRSQTHTFLELKQLLLNRFQFDTVSQYTSISGIQIDLKGRLETESVIPRVTKSTFQIGNINYTPTITPTLINKTPFSSPRPTRIQRATASGINHLGKFSITVALHP